MATFGEITEPSTRVAWEDWDVAENGDFPKLQWEQPLQIPEQVGKFFIFEGKCLWSGVRAKKTILEVNCVREANLHLYKTPHTNHFVTVIKDCDLLMSHAVLKLLKDLLMRSKMIVTIQEKPLSQFQSNETLTTPHVLRKITTTNKLNLMKENVSKLEQPNIITGVSAGVFSMREHFGLSATAIVIFMEPQENQVEDIENLLQKMDMSGAASPSNANPVVNNNLYT